MKKRYNTVRMMCIMAFMTFLVHGTAMSAPLGGVVAAGQATITTEPNSVQINQTTDKAVIDWQKFDIKSNEHTDFKQPSTDSITLNRVHSNTASNIDGKLTANGNVVIVNQNGVMFGKNAKIDVNGLIATTSDIDCDHV